MLKELDKISARPSPNYCVLYGYYYYYFLVMRTVLFGINYWKEMDG